MNVIKLDTPKWTCGELGCAYETLAYAYDDILKEHVVWYREDDETYVTNINLKTNANGEPLMFDTELEAELATNKLAKFYEISKTYIKNGDDLYDFVMYWARANKEKVILRVGKSECDSYGESVNAEYEYNKIKDAFHAFLKGIR